ncbi:MAG TPA: hypothetical protein PKC76_08615 [Saprospiraceae bacterium]|nr:hypothetical protein [Saprospiraceae bacterium]HMP24180.1 hypothetical protein [Saprospiraceae bacterium]
MKQLEMNQMEVLEGGANCLRAVGVNAAFSLMFGGWGGLQLEAVSLMLLVNIRIIHVGLLVLVIHSSNELLFS